MSSKAKLIKNSFQRRPSRDERGHASDLAGRRVAAALAASVRRARAPEGERVVLDVGARGRVRARGVGREGFGLAERRDRRGGEALRVVGAVGVFEPRGALREQLEADAASGSKNAGSSGDDGGGGGGGGRGAGGGGKGKGRGGKGGGKGE